MSKAILVMDMPEKCDECPCFQIGLYNYCSVTGRRNHSESNKKPSNCPLKLIPAKDVCDYTWDWELGYKRGWNSCIDRILGN